MTKNDVTFALLTLCLTGAPVFAQPKCPPPAKGPKAVGPKAGGPKTGGPKTGGDAGATLTKVEISHQGRKRVFYYHGRVNPRSKARKPVIFVLHGGGGDALMMAEAGFDAVADRDGFMTVYPAGIDGNWNDGRSGLTKTGVDVSKNDDVGFMAKVFDHVTDKLKGDPKRFYVTGVSNGGTMAYRLGIELTDRVAAIAPVVANLPRNLAAQLPKSPLPVLIMNGTADPLMLWEGGDELFSVEETLRYWLEQNRAGTRPVGTTSEHLPDLDRKDNSTVEVITFTGLKAPVVLYKVHGGGHSLPGGSGSLNLPAAVVGYKNMDISGPEEIWAFFSAHKLK